MSILNKLVKGAAKGGAAGAAKIAKALDPMSAVRQSEMPKGRITPGYKMPKKMPMPIMKKPMMPKVMKKSAY
jgi:hypothetical protein